VIPSFSPLRTPASTRSKPEVLEGLLSELQAVCAGFPDSRAGRKGNIAMADFGLSAFSMFFMQGISFLAYQRFLENEVGKSNCQTLFGITHIPSDNSIRNHLDLVHPKHLQPCFDRMTHLLRTDLQLSATFSRLGGRTLIAFDGTEYFCSYKITCPHCLTRGRNNGQTESYHTMLSATVVAPGVSRVVPLMPEFIANTDGAEKQDCERNAVKRWLSQHGDRMKPLCPVYLGDDLFACQPVAEEVLQNGADFIFTCKPTSHKALYDFMEGAAPETHEERIRKGKVTDTFRYRWIEQVPIRDSKDALSVNWIGFEILDSKGKIKYSMSWVTSLAVSKENVAEIVACGRSRWKIENEGFNVMKNHGYELEHNFGHGKQYLAMMFAALNLLAFAWHSVLDLIEPPWQAARAAVGKRTTFFGRFLHFTIVAIYPDWESLLAFITAPLFTPDIIVRRRC